MICYVCGRLRISGYSIVVPAGVHLVLLVAELRLALAVFGKGSRVDSAELEDSSLSLFLEADPLECGGAGSEPEEEGRDRNDESVSLCNGVDRNVANSAERQWNLDYPNLVMPATAFSSSVASCCRCCNTGVCVRCSCVKAGAPCLNCVPGRLGRCRNVASTTTCSSLPAPSQSSPPDDDLQPSANHLSPSAASPSAVGDPGLQLFSAVSDHL